MDNSNAKGLSNDETEILLLKNFTKDEDYDLPETLKHILIGKYEDVINNGVPAELLRLFCDNDDMKKLIHDNIETQSDTHHSWLCTGVASLLYFVQCNWTGPQADVDIAWLKMKRDVALKELSLTDECNTNVQKLELLHFAKLIFSSESLQDTYSSCIWWLFRANLLHQSVLNETSGVLFEETEELLKRIIELDVLKDQYCKTLFNIEAAQFYFYYRRPQYSEKHVECAEETAKICLSLEGALGKRTKYQQEEKPQLFLKIQLEKDHFPSIDCNDLPKSLDLNDDVRLEQIEFSEHKEHVELGAMEEAIILAKQVQIQLSQPVDKLSDEEIKPYLTTVINCTKNWCLKVTALSRRCMLESTHKRTIERAMMQMEYLLQEIKNAQVPVAGRIHMFFASGVKSFWMLQEMWANFMLSLGLVKGALDVFIKLEIWEDVITCYNLLELKHKAAEIIRQEISKKPTVRLWCLLGDATQDPSHYETAWKLSNEKSSRAQRHWGFFYFSKHEYEKAIPHLKLSVELNNIQEIVWIRLGFAALETQDWKLAATAYRRYCDLGQSTFEAWNNLAKAYVKLGDKPRAWKCLQDAIKCNYDHWQVWDNLMVVSIDLGHFSEVIRCYHRILDIKNQHLDVQVLNILTDAIINDINDVEGNPVRRLLPKALELFGRISASIKNSPDIWRMYGQLTALKKTDIDDQKAAQYLQQAHRAAVSNPKWFQQEVETEEVLGLCCILAEAYLRCSSDTDAKKKRSLLGSAKLSLQGVLKKVKDQEWNTDVIKSSLQKVEKYLDTITDELEKIKTAI